MIVNFDIMQYLSVLSRVFLNTALQALENNGVIVLLLRYPGGAGSRDYLLFDSLKALQHFLSQRKAKQAITLFKSIEIIKRGVVSKELLSQVSTSVLEPKYTDWLTIFQSYNDSFWNYCQNQNELLLELKEHLVEEVIILEDPLWQEEVDTVTAYMPDSDGLIRPTAY